MVYFCIISFSYYSYYFYCSILYEIYLVIILNFWIYKHSHIISWDYHSRHFFYRYILFYFFNTFIWSFDQICHESTWTPVLQSIWIFRDTLLQCCPNWDTCTPRGTQHWSKGYLRKQYIYIYSNVSNYFVGLFPSVYWMIIYFDIILLSFHALI